MVTLENHQPGPLAIGQQKGEPGQEPGAPGTELRPTLPAHASRPAFSQLARALNEEDLNHPGAKKLLLDRLDQLAEELEYYKGFFERYHESEMRAAVLEERMKQVTAIELAHSAMLTIGAAIAGLGPSMPQHSWAAYVIGGALIVAGIAVRLVRR